MKVKRNKIVTGWYNGVSTCVESDSSEMSLIADELVVSEDRVSLVVVTVSDVWSEVLEVSEVVSSGRVAVNSGDGGLSPAPFTATTM